MNGEKIIDDGAPWIENDWNTTENKIMNLRDVYDETKVKSVKKVAEGSRNRDGKVWELSYQEVMVLGLIIGSLNGKFLS